MKLFRRNPKREKVRPQGPLLATLFSKVSSKDHTEAQKGNDPRAPSIQLSRDRFHDLPPSDLPQITEWLPGMASTQTSSSNESEFHRIPRPKISANHRKLPLVPWSDLDSVDASMRIDPWNTWSEPGTPGSTGMQASPGYVMDDSNLRIQRAVARSLTSSGRTSPDNENEGRASIHSPNKSFLARPNEPLEMDVVQDIALDSENIISDTPKKEGTDDAVGILTEEGTRHSLHPGYSMEAPWNNEGVPTPTSPSVPRFSIDLYGCGEHNPAPTPNSIDQYRRVDPATLFPVSAAPPAHTPLSQESPINPKESPESVHQMGPTHDTSADTAIESRQFEGYADDPYTADDVYAMGNLSHVAIGRGALVEEESGNEGAHDQTNTPSIREAGWMPSLEILMMRHTPVDLSGLITIPDRSNPAHGGLADVYAGLWNGIMVAVKVLRIRRSRRADADWETSNERRITREMHVWSALKHPNISEFLGYSTDFGDYPSMISTWCKRGTASDYLEHKDRPVNERIRLAQDVSEGLHFLHRLKVVHGDLKPSNVLIDDACVARLCDFGLVRLVDWEGPAGMTTTSPYLGTERYKAPELFFSADNRHPVATFEGDIYSLGCIMLEFVELLYPFQRFKRNQELRSAIIDGYAPALRSEATNVLLHMTEQFWDLLEACWGERVNRPVIGSVVDELQFFCSALQGSVRVPGQVSAPTPVTMEGLMKIYAPVKISAPVNITGRIVAWGPPGPGQDPLLEVYTGFCNHVQVAVKVLKVPKPGTYTYSWWKYMQKILAKEMHVWSALRHRNISEFLGYSTELQDGFTVALISLWYHRSDAREYLLTECLSVNDRIRLAQDVADGLLHMHKHKVIHGNLKPTNVLIDNDGVAKICDFVHARLVDWQGHPDMNTMTLNPQRSGRYTPPELLKSGPALLPITFEGDIYSLGCVMLDFIEQVAPFQELGNIEGLRNAIMNGDPPALREDSTNPLSHSTPEFWDLLEACWDKPSRRPAITMVVDALNNLARPTVTSS